MLIVESLTDKKRVPAYAKDKVISLGDIAIYTTETEVPLHEVLTSVKNKENGLLVKPRDVNELSSAICELVENETMTKFGNSEFADKPTNYYNLDMIISLGYRIKSVIATRFRQWATKRLKEYMIKGFTIDDERLKGNGGGNYWKELLDRIRDIRSSEKVLYRQVILIWLKLMQLNINLCTWMIM